MLPSAGLNFLRQVGWLAHFSEVSALVGVPQDPEWHPEGDVWTHTLHCCDALAELPEWRALEEETRIAVMFAVLAHDFAKPQCTFATEKHGQMRIVSPGHEPAGAPIAEVFLHRIGASHSLLARVPPLVANHLAHLQEQTPRSVRRLANRLAPKGGALDVALELAAQLSAFPQLCLRNDRLSALDQWSLDWDQAQASEVAYGMETLRSGVSRDGAARFAAGEGRGGKF